MKIWLGFGDVALFINVTEEFKTNIACVQNISL